MDKLLGVALLPERLEGGDPRGEEAVAESHQRAPKDAQAQPEPQQHRQRDEPRQLQARVDAVRPGFRMQGKFGTVINGGNFCSRGSFCNLTRHKLEN